MSAPQPPVRKPAIARYVSSTHAERVDEAAAREIWEGIAAAIDDIYNKVSKCRSVYVCMCVGRYE